VLRLGPLGVRHGRRQRVRQFATTRRPNFVQIDDAYAVWYKARHDKDIDRSLVLPVRHALQGHPESASLWEQHITAILSSLGLSSTTHERNIYQGTINSERVLVCRQVDNLAVACAYPTTAKKVIALIGGKVDLTGNSILTKFNGVDVNQTQDYIKLHCSSYIERLLASHGWEKRHPNEAIRTSIEPIPASIVAQIDSEIGPAEHTAEAALLAKEMGYDYRSLLGELIYAYTVCRLDIGYAVTKLARHSQSPEAASTWPKFAI
jgi:hypothetical protein